ncbi:MAG TPA: hypothetical protein PKA06_04525 [Gemmatales bacterium]|nr:hypothetical protein [Gemmatales bacterium]HMP16821.1 hypothetical protein [Gemmatales bacterium]
MAAVTSNSPPTIHPELKKYQTLQLPRDLDHLRRGANHLKVIAWFIFIPSMLFTFVSFLFLLMRPQLGNFGFFFIMLVFLGISCFYFSVSSYISRARRWAVYVAMAVAIMPILISIPLILSPQIGIHKRTEWTLLVEILYLIGHIKMISDLYGCLGAVDRIHWAAQVRYQSENARNPWDTPRS